MLGKILSVARTNHDIANQKFDENKAQIKDALAKIETMQAQIDTINKNQTQTMNEFKSEMIDAFSRLE